MIIVYIWYPKVGWDKYLNSSASSVNLRGAPMIAFGHAAIELGNGTYISKWPKHKVRAGYMMCYQEDKDLIGDPQDVIEIHGLNEIEIEEYWESARARKFEDLNFNCCFVVAQALKIGFDNSVKFNFDGGFEQTFYQLLGTGMTVLERYMKMLDRPVSAVKNEFGYIFNESTTWTPYTVAGYAKYIKRIIE
jgi:hypothetical protein